MDIIAAKNLALNLIEKHLDKSENWQFRFSRGRNQFGACRVKVNRITKEIVFREITLSKLLTQLNNEKHVLDTILHEIAHAKAGHTVHHGPEWKAEAIKLGAKPEPCFSTSEVNISYKWRGICGDCGKEYKRHRISSRLKVARHTPCVSKEKRGELIWEQAA